MKKYNELMLIHDAPVYKFIIKMSSHWSNLSNFTAATRSYIYFPLLQPNHDTYLKVKSLKVKITVQRREMTFFNNTNMY